MGLLARSLLLTLAAGVMFVAGDPHVASPTHLPGQRGLFITNGVVTLGVNAEGDLNVSDTTLPHYPGPSTGGTSAVGLRFNVTNFDAIAPGCQCEGWGVAIDDGPSGEQFSGWVNRNFSPAVNNLQAVSFTSDETATTPATTATSVVTINDASGSPALEVTHVFRASTLPNPALPGHPGSPNLYRVDVTIRNITTRTLGTAAMPLRYRRVMDWDIEPTDSSEFVTLGGLAPLPTNLLFASDDGFVSADPLAGAPQDLAGCGITSNFIDCGPGDHGAVLDFAFPALAPGASQPLSIFYGAAATEALADEARTLAGVEVFSYGQCDAGQGQAACNEGTGTPNTFIFGFAGVGGTAPPPPPPPPPPAGEPILCVSPDSLKFGKVVVGGFRDLRFAVTNVGTGLLSGTASIVNGPAFQIVSGNPFNNLAAGESQVVTVRFTPTSPGTVFAAIVKFESNGGNAERLVRGTGAPLAIENVKATPETLWPADGRMVPVTLAVTFRHAHNVEPACRIVSVSSDEPGERRGRRKTATDWNITGSLTVDLKARRSGRDDDEGYTITVSCTDASGKSVVKTVTVNVGRSDGKKSRAAAVETDRDPHKDKDRDNDTERAKDKDRGKDEDENKETDTDKDRAEHGDKDQDEAKDDDDRDDDKDKTPRACVPAQRDKDHAEERDTDHDKGRDKDHDKGRDTDQGAERDKDRAERGDSDKRPDQARDEKRDGDKDGVPAHGDRVRIAEQQDSAGAQPGDADKPEDRGGLGEAENERFLVQINTHLTPREPAESRQARPRSFWLEDVWGDSPGDGGGVLSSELRGLRHRLALVEDGQPPGEGHPRLEVWRLDVSDGPPLAAEAHVPRARHSWQLVDIRLSPAGEENGAAAGEQHALMLRAFLEDGDPRPDFGKLSVGVEEPFAPEPDRAEHGDRERHQD